MFQPKHFPGTFLVAGEVDDDALDAGFIGIDIIEARDADHLNGLFCMNLYKYCEKYRDFLEKYNLPLPENEEELVDSIFVMPTEKIKLRARDAMPGSDFKRFIRYLKYDGLLDLPID
jgi:hypothetical protein